MIQVEENPTFKWTLRSVVSGEDVDFNFAHITDEPTWERKIEGRIATDPCTAQRTLIARNNGVTLPLRRGPLTMYLGTENGNTPDENLALGVGLFAAGGPYILITPKNISFNIIFDYETSWREQRTVGGYYKVIVGVAEV